jgi:hypothetical protein
MALVDKSVNYPFKTLELMYKNIALQEKFATSRKSVSYDVVNYIKVGNFNIAVTEYQKAKEIFEKKIGNRY